MDRADEIARACENADWQQVVLNGGPPCFHQVDGKFCLRAERWQGHGIMHPFVPLLELLRDFAKEERERGNDRLHDFLDECLSNGWFAGGETERMAAAYVAAKIREDGKEKP